MSHRGKTPVLQAYRRFSSPRALAITGTIAAFGVVAVLAALADNSFFTSEPESGAISSSASVISDSTASGGRAIQFGSGTVPTPTHTPGPTSPPPPLWTLAPTNNLPGQLLAGSGGVTSYSSTPVYQGASTPFQRYDKNGTPGWSVTAPDWTQEYANTPVADAAGDVFSIVTILTQGKTAGAPFLTMRSGGETKWSTPLPDTIYGNFQLTLGNNKVYLFDPSDSTPGVIQTFSADDGTLENTYQLPPSFYPTVTAYLGGVVLSQNSKIIFLDASGAYTREYDIPASIAPGGSGVVAVNPSGTIFFDTGNPAYNYPNTLAAISPDGTLKWSTVLPAGFQGNNTYAAPVIATSDGGLAFYSQNVTLPEPSGGIYSGQVLAKINSDGSFAWVDKLDTMIASDQPAQFRQLISIHGTTTGKIVLAMALSSRCGQTNGGCNAQLYSELDQTTGNLVADIGQSGNLTVPYGDPSAISYTSNGADATVADDRLYSLVHQYDPQNPNLVVAITAFAGSGLGFDYPENALRASVTPHPPPPPPAPPPGQAPPSYIALGDSVAAGEGINYGFLWDSFNNKWVQVGPIAPDWFSSSIAGQACHQSVQGYPHKLASLEGWSLTDDRACTSAMSAYPATPYPGEEGLGGILDKEKFYNTDTNSPDFGLLFATAGHPQLGSSTISGADAPNDYGAPDDITLTVGANDIDFADWLSSCYAFPFINNAIGVPPSCGSSDDDRLITNEISNATNHLHDVLDEINNRAVTSAKHPNVYVTGYHDPFPATYPGYWDGTQWVSSCPDIDIPGTANVAGLTPLEMDWIRSKLVALNASIAIEVGKWGPTFHYVDISNILQPSATQPSHTYCSGDPWAYGPSIEAFAPGNPAPFHPTPNGQRAIANAIAAAVAAGH